MLWRAFVFAAMLSAACFSSARAQAPYAYQPPIQLVVHSPSPHSPARLVQLADEASRPPSLLAPGTAPVAAPVISGGGTNAYPATGWVSASGGCPCIAAPPATVYYPASPPAPVYYSSSPYAASAPHGVVTFRPVVALRPMPVSYVAGQGILGQPKLYMPGQPIRNFIRYLTP